MEKISKARGRGRPTKPKNEKQAPITFRLSPQERALIDHAAMVQGVKRTELIRAAAVKVSNEILRSAE